MQMTDNSPSLKPLLDLMSCRKLKEVKKLAKQIEISRDGFYKLILLAQAERLDVFSYLHQTHCREHQPEELQLTDKDLKGIANNGKGALKGDAIKAFSKINQMFKVRKWTVGHMFYTPDLKFWHFFYFDLKDMATENNHWKFGGSHIHYISDLNPQYTAESAWDQFVCGSKSFGGDVHLKYRK
jgi:hypothetical protein